MFHKVGNAFIFIFPIAAQSIISVNKWLYIADIQVTACKLVVATRYKTNARQTLGLWFNQEAQLSLTKPHNAFVKMQWCGDPLKHIHPHMLPCQIWSFYITLSEWVGFSVPINTLYIILETSLSSQSFALVLTT